MINFNNVTKDRLSSIASNYAEALIEDRGNNIEDLASGFADAGFTKSEFFQILDNYYLSDYRWAEESEADEKVNTETGEGVFWKEYTEDKDVSVGDTDRAILETALTQIGIPYSYERLKYADGRTYSEWVDLKIADGDYITDNTAARIYFTLEGKYKNIE